MASRAPPRIAPPRVHQLAGNRAFGRLQAKLMINQPGDAYEVEADSVADQVMRMPEAHVQRKCACGGTCDDCKDEEPHLQRAAASSVPAVSSGLADAPAHVGDVLGSGGEALDASTRVYMESRFGHDFAAVRIHRDAGAAASARAVATHAYTVGRDIVFASGQYTPETTAGRRLLAHELSHVLQQRDGAAVIMRQADACLRECERQFDACLGRTRFPPECIASRGQCMNRCPPAGPEELAARRQARVARVRELGFNHGFHLAEAADSVSLHNQSQVPDDWDFIPEDRRPFIQHVDGTPRGRWRVVSPPVLLANREEVESFVNGVNAGLEQHARIERFFEPIAEGLQLLAMALSTSAAMRMAAEPMLVEPVAPVGGRPPQLRLIRGGGGSAPETVAPRPVTGPSRAPVSAGRGGAARALAEVPEVTPQPVRPRPELVHSQPQEAVVPRAAAAPQQAPSPGTLPSAVPLPAALAALQGKPRPANAYPICWPIHFGPAPATVFIKTTPPDRDYAEQQQAALVRRWLRAFRDPGFVAERYHVHHVLPLFLGGADDLARNAMTLLATTHLRSHAVLRHQPQMATPPPPLQPLGPDIYRHPVGTMYWLAGYKENPEQVCP
jgi:hypothetical protein